MKILLIDDEAFALKLIVHQLAAIGFHEVTALQSAAEALAHLADGGTQFDLIITDLQMPDKDGIELVRDLAQTGYPGALVLISGEDLRILQTAERLARAHQLRVLGSLHKPVTPERLRALLAINGNAVNLQPRREVRNYTADELGRGIEADELICYCQPQVSLATGLLTGAEILVRWQHPENGLVFPDQFIALAEEHGLIEALTRTVLRETLKQIRLWHDVKLIFPVAVNVSMDNLIELEFADHVANALNQAGVPPSGLILEVTEGRLMKDLRLPLDILSRLRLKGVELSIDDFGTGHSSLAQLRDLPFNELKIDHSFVHGAWHDDELAAILTGSLDMAKRLGMRTVAEGIEDKDDWDFVRKSGCDVAQGYFIARPMPMAELPSWLYQWKLRRRELGLS